ncbi:DUF3472 domain-containing protein [Singulisphaera acidiphila]|uniref:Lysophospholipase L1-like esterase n=1 Tax=Singulisphaera acidiphila (strain ATCC BAA-1392 / DSM 18658 / VKM B-2454 / MOB10) TaxID=886293 RepID=L0DM41_SINAD|nr:DUF3472 domain-containing protein [Singulisphaera acidiphila]AGA29870.1 lysophospholipase L1-like esterase [Singulisphaera acidiphila DSM 18658]
MIQHVRGLAGILALATWVLAVAEVQADERLKDIACRSVHLGYPAPEGVAFSNEITIQQSAVGTYFMVCGWDKGYFGLQELGNGKKLLIFSVWDSEQNDPKAVQEDHRTKLISKDEKVRTGRFGGEGTGGQSFFDYDWKVGTTYRFLVAANVKGQRTEYSGYFFVPESQEWKHLITFSTVTGGKFLSGYYSFIEDFKRDRISATKARQARFANGWVMAKNGDWTSLSKARFTGDSNPVTNINAFVDGDQYALATGGETENNGVKLRELMSLPSGEKRKPPEGLPRIELLASADSREAAQPSSAPLPVAQQLAGLHLLQGPWDEGNVHRESVLFVRSEDGKSSAKLLFDAERVIAVQSADGQRWFEAERDFAVAPDGSGLVLAPHSTIPFLNETDFFVPKGSANSIGHRAGHPETSVLFDNSHYFHDRQIEVSYVPRGAKWDAYRPKFAAERLGRTLAKLKKREALTIAVSGDSISEGFNASEFTKTKPFMPPYPTLVAAQLEQTYGAKVTLHNLAVGGWSSGQGASNIDKVLKCKPDLVLIAYGMNDVGTRNPEAFKANIKSMLSRIQEAAPTTEVILIATMTGNPDWMATPPEMFPVYRDALATLEGPGVVLSDLTAVWQRLLKRKRHFDVTGNGVNHPNDYGHRVYAQAILGLLVDPESNDRKAP